MTMKLAAAFVVYEVMRGHSPMEVVRSALMPVPTTPPYALSGCNEQYCPPKGYLIHVDKPVNTVLRDDSQGGTTLSAAYQYQKNQYLKEAIEHPGVALVAHTIV